MLRERGAWTDPDTLHGRRLVTRRACPGRLATGKRPGPRGCWPNAFAVQVPTSIRARSHASRSEAANPALNRGLPERHRVDDHLHRALDAGLAEDEHELVHALGHQRTRVHGLQDV